MTPGEIEAAVERLARIERLANLASSLRWAGALCAAWHLGSTGAHRIWCHDEHNEWSRGKPGCQQPAPGWGRS